jgi:hypothetical protein
VDIRLAGTWTLLALIVAGCAGSGIPKQQPGETYPGERHEVTGTVEWDGCARLRLDDGTSHAVIWPESATNGSDIVNLGWFQRDVVEGDWIEGTAALTPVVDLPYWGESGYWESVLGTCIRLGETEALVFDEARLVED